MHKWGVTMVVTASLATGAAVIARTPAAPADIPPVAMATLPAEAQATHRLILSGGPFPYEKDGSVFGNRERLLPPRARGHYREYTVKTPGVRSRGARRIVCGQPSECYYSDDHYETFKLIRE